MDGARKSSGETGLDLGVVKEFGSTYEKLKAQRDKKDAQAKGSTPLATTSSETPPMIEEPKVSPEIVEIKNPQSDSPTQQEPSIALMDEPKVDEASPEENLSIPDFLSGSDQQEDEKHQEEISQPAQIIEDSPESGRLPSALLKALKKQTDESNREREQQQQVIRNALDNFLAQNVGNANTQETNEQQLEQELKPQIEEEAISPSLGDQQDNFVNTTPSVDDSQAIESNEQAPEGRAEKPKVAITSKEALPTDLEVKVAPTQITDTVPEEEDKNPKVKIASVEEYTTDPGQSLITPIDDKPIFTDDQILAELGPVSIENPILAELKRLHKLVEEISEEQSLNNPIKEVYTQKALLNLRKLFSTSDKNNSKLSEEQLSQSEFRKGFGVDLQILEDKLAQKQKPDDFEDIKAALLTENPPKIYPEVRAHDLYLLIQEIKKTLNQYETAEETADLMQEKSNLQAPFEDDSRIDDLNFALSEAEGQMSEAVIEQITEEVETDALSTPELTSLLEKINEITLNQRNTEAQLLALQQAISERSNGESSTNTSGEQLSLVDIFNQIQSLPEETKKILGVNENKTPDLKALVEQIESMLSDQDTQNSENLLRLRKEILEKLEEQAQSSFRIAEAILGGMNNLPEEFRDILEDHQNVGQTSKEIEDTLSKLLRQGTINQNQYNTILDQLTILNAKAGNSVVGTESTSQAPVVIVIDNSNNRGIIGDVDGSPAINSGDNSSQVTGTNNVVRGIATGNSSHAEANDGTDLVEIARVVAETVKTVLQTPGVINPAVPPVARPTVPPVVDTTIPPITRPITETSSTTVETSDSKELKELILKLQEQITELSSRLTKLEEKSSSISTEESLTDREEKLKDKAKDLVGDLTDEEGAALEDAGKETSGFMASIKKTFNSMKWGRVMSQVLTSFGVSTAVWGTTAVATAFVGAPIVATVVGGAMAVLGLVTIAKSIGNVAETAKNTGQSWGEVVKSGDFWKGAALGTTMTALRNGMLLLVPGWGLVGAVATILGNEAVLAVQENKLNQEQDELVKNMIGNHEYRRYIKLKDQGILVRGEVDGKPTLSLDTIINDAKNAPRADEKKTAIKAAIAMQIKLYAITKDESLKFVKVDGKDVEINSLGLQTIQQIPGSDTQYTMYGYGKNIEGMIEKLDVDKLIADVQKGWGQVDKDKKTEVATDLIKTFAGIETADVDMILSEQRKKYLERVAFTTGMFVSTGIINGLLLTGVGGMSAWENGQKMFDSTSTPTAPTAPTGPQTGNGVQAPSDVSDSLKQTFNDPNMEVYEYTDANGDTIYGMDLGGDGDIDIYRGPQGSVMFATPEGAEQGFETMWGGSGDIDMQQIQDGSSLKYVMTDSAGDIQGVIVQSDTAGYIPIPSDTVLNTPLTAISADGSPITASISEIMADGSVKVNINGNEFDNISLGDIFDGKGLVSIDGSDINITNGSIRLEGGESVNSLLHDVLEQAKADNPNLADVDRYELERMMYRDGIGSTDGAIRTETGLSRVTQPGEVMKWSESPTIMNWLRELNGGDINISGSGNGIPGNNITLGFGQDLTGGALDISGLGLTDSPIDAGSDGANLITQGVGMLAVLAGLIPVKVGGIVRTMSVNPAKGDDKSASTSSTTTVLNDKKKKSKERIQIETEKLELTQNLAIVTMLVAMDDNATINIKGREFVKRSGGKWESLGMEMKQSEMVSILMLNESATSTITKEERDTIIRRTLATELKESSTITIENIIYTRKTITEIGRSDRTVWTADVKKEDGTIETKELSNTELGNKIIQLLDRKIEVSDSEDDNEGKSESNKGKTEKTKAELEDERRLELGGLARDLVSVVELAAQTSKEVYVNGVKYTQTKEKHLPKTLIIADQEFKTSYKNNVPFVSDSTGAEIKLDDFINRMNPAARQAYTEQLVYLWQRDTNVKFGIQLQDKFKNYPNFLEKAELVVLLRGLPKEELASSIEKTLTAFDSQKKPVLKIQNKNFSKLVNGQWTSSEDAKNYSDKELASLIADKKAKVEEASSKIEQSDNPEGKGKSEDKEAKDGAKNKAETLAQEKKMSGLKKLAIVAGGIITGGVAILGFSVPAMTVAIAGSIPSAVGFFGSMFTDSHERDLNTQMQALAKNSELKENERDAKYKEIQDRINNTIRWNNRFKALQFFGIGVSTAGLVGQLIEQLTISLDIDWKTIFNKPELIQQPPSSGSENIPLIDIRP